MDFVADSKGKENTERKGWTFGKVNIQGEPVAKGWKRDTILVSPSFCLFDSVHLFSEAGEEREEWFRHVYHDSQIGMKLEIWNFTCDEVKNIKIGSFIYKSFSFLFFWLILLQFCETLKKKEWIRIIGTNLKFSKIN